MEKVALNVFHQQLRDFQKLITDMDYHYMWLDSEGKLGRKSNISIDEFMRITFLIFNADNGTEDRLSKEFLKDRECKNDI